MKISVTRPISEDILFKTVNEEFTVDTRYMDGMEIELEDDSIIIFCTNDEYFDILSKYYIDNDFDLDRFNEDYLDKQDDVIDATYRNKDVTGASLYNINQVPSYRLEF